ncbi:hypothetical protein [Novosphingobium sp.]|uniref:hypothetical protein n=1 Tax=Novosphingobium sp. TaxID=1874826 RepID=UPI00286E22AD|nr:hypothetical protein [Novosphingobium sp.]
MFDAVFANLATSFSAVFGGPYEDATAKWPGSDAEYDTGGSITTPGTPVLLACKVQFDAVTQAMRADAGFLETDVRLIVLASSITAPLDTRAKIIVTTGPNIGAWELHSASLDPARIGWECRGRRI